jgi:hypothetical protein
MARARGIVAPTLMIDEKSSRKPCFDEVNSVWVDFANDNRFAVPLPWLQVRPTFREGKPVDAYRVFTYSEAIDGLIDAIGEAETADHVICGIASLGAYLLGQQYDLTDAELDNILAYNSTEPSTMEWTRQLIAIARGRSGPKVVADGDA